MKITEIFLFITIIILSTIFTGKAFSSDKPSLTPEFLASGKWSVEDNSACTSAFEFTAKGKFKFSHECHASEDWVDVSGSYKIKGNKIIYKIEDGKTGSDAILKLGHSGEANLSDRNSIKYRCYLEFDNLGIGRVYNKNSLIKNAELVLIKDIEAVSTGGTSATVVNSLKMREAPTTSAKEITLDLCVNGLHASAKSIEKGTSLTVYAHTKEKDKVGKWNNYWYYVEFNDNNCEDGAYNSGWVFGEFIKLK